MPEDTAPKTGQAKTLITTTDSSPWTKPNDDLTKPNDVVTPAPVPAETHFPVATSDAAASDDKETDVRRNDAGEPLSPEESKKVPPIEELLTPNDDGETGPTGPDDRPDAFVPGDQTAAGHLTPPGARHPGGTGQADPLDPYNVNNGNYGYHQTVAANAEAAKARQPNPETEQPEAEQNEGD